MADVRVEGPAVERGEEILTPEALAFVADLQTRFGAAPRRAAGRPRHPPGRDRRGPADRLPPGDRGRPRRRLAGAAAAARPGRPPGRDHRPDRAEDGDQRAQLRRERLAGRPRGRQHPALAQRRRRAGRAEGRRPPDAVVHQPGRPGVPAPRGRRAADDRAAPARLAPARAAPAGRRRAGGRRARRRGPLPVPQRARSSSTAAAARTSTCRRWRATSRPGCGRWCSTTPSRCSASRPGSIRATMLIETIPAAFEMEEMLHELGSHAAGLNAGRWDYLFSVIKVFRDAGPEFVLPDRAAVTMTAPMMRAYTEQLVAVCHRRGAHGDRRHGRVHPEPPRRRGQRAGAGQGPRGQDPRGRRRLRRLLGGPPRPGAGLPGGLRRRARRPAQPARPAAATRSHVDRRSSCSTSPACRASGTMAGLRGQRRGGDPLPGGVAGRQRRGRHPRPDGGRRHRRDQPLAGVAVGAHRRRAGHRRDGHRGAGPPGHRRGGGRASASSTGSTTPGGCSSRWRWPTTSRTS